VLRYVLPGILALSVEFCQRAVKPDCEYSVLFNPFSVQIKHGYNE